MEKMMMITRRKAKERKSKDVDDEEIMTLVKAAAWAWFQHGSGSKGKSFQEFSLTRPEKVVTPSRFKLEAKRIEINNNDSSSDSSSSEYHSLTLSPAQTDNSLLDAYEIDQISRQLDFLIETSNNDTRRHHRRSSFANDRGHKKNLPLPPPQTSPGSEKLSKNPKKLNGSWMLRYGVACSSIEGVVEPRLGAVCGSIKGVVDPRLLNRQGRRMQGSSNHQRKAHYK